MCAELGGELMRRRLLSESKQGFQPYYSDYPVFTEYGTYRLTPQTDDSSHANSFVKLDDTSYNWCGSCMKNSILYVQYTKNSFETIFSKNDGSISTRWFIKEQESKVARFKRCTGTESSEPLVEFYVEKVD